MVSTQLTKLDEDERIRQLAGEIVIRAIQDIRLLQRRGILDGVRITGKTDVDLGDCDEYQEPDAIKTLVDDFMDGTMLFWCKVAGVNLDQQTLNRVINGENKWNILNLGSRSSSTESHSSSPLGSQSVSLEAQ